MSVEKFVSICFYMMITILTVWMAGHILPENGKKMLLQWPVRKESVYSFLPESYERSYLLAITGILFLCSALRFDIGNDYEQYAYTAHEVSVNGYVVTESGFNWVVKLIYAIFGFECYEAVFAVFAFATIVLFMKAMYEQSADFSISFLLFMTLGMYFQTYNTVRYYFALAIVLYATKYVLQKDWIRFVCWILFAAFFHKSVLLVIPVYVLASKRWKVWQMCGLVMLSALAFLLKGPVLQLALHLYPSYKNTVYLEGGTTVSSIIRTGVIILLCILYWKNYGKQCKQQQLFWFCTQLNFLALLVYVFFSFLPVVTRIAYYFTVSQLLLIPVMIHGISKEKNRIVAYGLLLAVCSVYFVLFLLTADKPGVVLLPYKSWLFSTTSFR